MARRRNIVMPDRRFVVSIYFQDGTETTTIVYAPNPTAAEELNRYTGPKTAEVLRIVARSEVR